MTTRAKFKCVSVTKRASYPGNITDQSYSYDAEFSAVTSGGGPENAAFFKSTPNGNIKLTTLREDQFIPGAEYYVDFTSVEVAQPAS